jgi:putative tryptophan/tyrosine transport system substrate-binding protein
MHFLYRRREFITLLGGAAAWPLAARAQQPERVRRIGVLMSTAESDPKGQAWLGAFREGIQKLGWTEGRNVQIEYRWGAVDADRVRSYSAELVALAPDIILAAGGTIVGALEQATHTVPIVFVNATDPVGRGLIESLARPGGNVTGFTPFEFGVSAKWLELLKQIAPRVTRAAVIRDPTATGTVGQLAAIQSVAPSFGVELRSIDARDAGEIERGVTTFARGSKGGLIVTSSRLAVLHRDLIITLAAQHRLPAVYPYHVYATDGGLMSYGPDIVDQYRRGWGPETEQPDEPGSRRFSRDLRRSGGSRVVTSRSPPASALLIRFETGPMSQSCCGWRRMRS